MPCSSVCQFNLYRRSVRVSGSSGAVPCSRRTGKRQFCWLCCRFRFYAVFSAIISTALAKIMFASSGMMLASTALGRINQVMEAPTLEAPSHPQSPRSNKVEFKDVSFTYNGSESPALSHVFTAEPGQTVALVGPSGGGKTTAAQLDSAFWDANVRRGGSRRSQCCSDRSACPYGSGGFDIPE